MILDQIEPPCIAVPVPGPGRLMASRRIEGGAAAKPRVLLVFRSRYPESVEMLNGIARHLQTHDAWSVYVDDEARAEVDLQWLFSQDWSGVISRHTTPALVQACAERGIPLVDLNDTPQFAGVPKIRPDNPAIGAMGAAHLLDRGFRHFGFCGLRSTGWARERRTGFVDTVQRRGYACDVFEPDDAPASTPFDHVRQVEQIAAWLRRLPMPVAIMACHDPRANQVLEAARSTGRLIPEEIAVLGANNEAARCELASPPLSSVATHPLLSGLRAAERLAALMAGGDRSVDSVRIAPLKVVARRSTDVLAIPDRHVADAVRYIREHACENLTVDQVLPHAAVSRSQLEKKFRAYLGRSPQAEIRRVQVTRIRQLLAETNLPLKRIAELSGFDYMEYMCVVFRRLTGGTPGDYRRRTQPSARAIPPATGR